MNVMPMDTDAHRAVQALLPWYVTQRLDAQETQGVEAHLAQCPRCQADLDLERRVQAAQPLASTGDVEQAWARMRKAVRADARHAAAAPAPWLRWALGAQFALIALLATTLLWPRATDPAYRALGAAAALPAANAIVMFRPEASEAEIRAALRASGARLVDGPTASNAYLLSVPGDAPAAALQQLRAQPAVSLAQSLDARPAP